MLTNKTLEDKKVVRKGKTVDERPFHNLTTKIKQFLYLFTFSYLKYLVNHTCSLERSVFLKITKKNKPLKTSNPKTTIFPVSLKVKISVLIKSNL